MMLIGIRCAVYIAEWSECNKMGPTRQLVGILLWWHDTEGIIATVNTTSNHVRCSAWCPHKNLGSNNCCQIFIIICLWYSGFLTLTEILSVHSCCLLSWLLFRLFSYSSLSVFIFWLETDIGQSLPIPMNFSHNHPPVWLGGRVVRTLDLQSVGREFESWPVWYRV